jgi:hypothetical protein
MIRFGAHVRYGRLELFSLRALFALVIYARFPQADRYIEQPHPNGLAHVFDFTFLNAPGISEALQIGYVLALALYATGYALPWAIAYLLFTTVSAGTLSNSQGAISHSHQIIPLVLLGQLIAYCYCAWFEVRRRPLPLSPGLNAHDLSIYFAQQMVVSVYVAAGLTKLIRSQGRWIIDLPNIAVEIVKTHAQRYHDRLAPELLESGERIAGLILEYPNATRLLLSGGLVLELCAFLALGGRRLAFCVGVLLIAMHEMVELVMKLSFETNQLVILLFLVNVPFLIERGGRKIAHRFSQRNRRRSESRTNAPLR